MENGKKRQEMGSIGYRNHEAVYLDESKRQSTSVNLILKSRSDKHERSVGNRDFEKKEIAKHF